MAWTLAFKVVLISTAVLCAASGLKVSIPLVMEFLATHVPVMWSFCLLCFKPPYLYVIINVIIITIAVSSRFHHHSVAVDHQMESTPPPKVPACEMKSPPDVGSELTISEPPIMYEPSKEAAIVYEPREEPPVLDVKTVVVNGSALVEDEKAINNQMESRWTPLKRMDSTEIPLEYLPKAEKPLPSARFAYRQPIRASPEGGRALKVARPKQHETLENTWKAITEGQAMPLSRHTKTCDAWENDGRDVSVDSLEAKAVKKSKTFKEHGNESASTAPTSCAMSGGKLRKEPSLSQEELNRRVEAFIRKFNEEMRLQRQESLNQYLDMIDRDS